MKTRYAVVLIALVLCAGCASDPRPPLPDCTTPGVVTYVHGVDLLLMIDDSNSMREEQASLAQQLPRLVDAFALGEVRDAAGDVVRTFRPVASLQVGVVDSDMGTAGHVVPTCSESNFGDDGILRTRGDVTRAGCVPSYPSFLTFVRGSDPAHFADDFACVAILGTGGCGFEQQLEAVLKALTPASSSTTFTEGTRGHGDVENTGFLRPDSILGVILLTDEDDCSASDGDLFNSGSTRYTGDLNLRCSAYPEALYPTSRFVNGLLDLRPGNPELLVFGLIAGAPVDLVSSTTSSRGDIDYAALLADPRMQERPDPTMPERLTPSCDVPERGFAFPPVRMLGVARGLDAAGAGISVSSICQEDLSGAVNSIVDEFADVLAQRAGGCFQASLLRDAEGKVGCELLELLPSTGEVTSCAQLTSMGVEATLARTETRADGAHEVCRVAQSGVVDGEVSGRGWYVDDFSPGAQEVCAARGELAFSSGAEPLPSVHVSIDCPESAVDHVAGSRCELGAIDACISTTEPSLVCHPTLAICIVPCTRRSQCGAASEGWHCVQPDSRDCSGGVDCFCRQRLCR